MTPEQEATIARLAAEYAAAWVAYDATLADVRLDAKVLQTKEPQ